MLVDVRLPLGRVELVPVLAGQIREPPAEEAAQTLRRHVQADRLNDCAHCPNAFVFLPVGSGRNGGCLFRKEKPHVLRT